MPELCCNVMTLCCWLNLTARIENKQRKLLDYTTTYIVSYLTHIINYSDFNVVLNYVFIYFRI